MLANLQSVQDAIIVDVNAILDLEIVVVIDLTCCKCLPKLVIWV